jgi:hypothetical protein
VSELGDEALATPPDNGRWPLWATIGHLTCQRVFWLCDGAGEPGAETTPFANAAFDCPGDDDLEHVLDASALVDALDATFRIVDASLDRWTLDMLSEEISHPEWRGFNVYTRGSIVQRVFAHDVYHCAEINETLVAVGAPLIDLWD